MSTYLQLCQDASREVGIAGTGPITTIGQTGESADIVRWVKNAYIEIQNRNGAHWRWLRHEFTLVTSAGDDTYAFSDAIDSTTSNPIDRFSEWRFADRRNPPRIFLNTAGIGTQTWMTWVDWDSFQQIYRISNQVDSYPAHITIDPQDNIVLGPKPNEPYTITSEYWRSPQILAADADVPEMPPQFHNLIVWYAIEHYGYKESAPEVLEHARIGARRYMRQLERNQIERLTVAGPLA